MLSRPIFAACIVLLSMLRVACAQLDLPADAKELALTRGLALEGVSQWARRPINVDGVAALVVEGRLGDPAWGMPKPGDAVPVPPALAQPQKRDEAVGGAAPGDGATPVDHVGLGLPERGPCGGESSRGETTGR